MNKAIKSYNSLKEESRCPRCEKVCKSLSVLSRHMRKDHQETFADWIHEAHPNYCKNCGDQIIGRVQDVYKVEFCCLSCKSTGEFNSRYGAILSKETKGKIGDSNRGKVRSEEAKEKIRRWLAENGAPFKGRTHTVENKALMSKLSKERIAIHGHPFKGKKHSEESKKNMSEGHRKGMPEEWTGSFSRFCSILRMSLKPVWTLPVLERDNFKCQECGASEDLAVHHIKRFRDLVLNIIKEHPNLNVNITEHRWRLHDLCMKSAALLDLDNGITLCIDCYRQEHRAAA